MLIYPIGISGHILRIRMPHKKRIEIIYITWCMSYELYNKQKRKKNKLFVILYKNLSELQL